MSPVKHSKIIRLSGIFSLVLVAMGVMLFLPPVSLANRFLYSDYEIIGPGNQVLYANNGAQLTFMPSPDRFIWVKLDVVPGDGFKPDILDKDLSAAAQNLPSFLATKGPVYRINCVGSVPGAVALTLPIPPTVQPDNTLDLYTWDGTAWDWQPARRVLAKNIIEANLNFMPKAVAIMQTYPLNLGVSTTNYNAILSDELENMAVTVNLTGFRVEQDGRITGNLDQILPTRRNDNVVVMPTLRNWDETGMDDAGLAENLLVDPPLRQQHLKAIVGLAQRDEYDGIELDYRGLQPDARQEYTEFLLKLRQALPQNKQLVVRVDVPQHFSTGAWDTGAYDWPAIGRIADKVILPALPDPKAYKLDGEMEQMLNWAVGEINRYKIQLQFNPNSTEWIDGRLQPITDQQALEKIGGITAVKAIDQLEPGQTAEFTLSGQLASTGVQVDHDSGAYWFGYLDKDNRHHTVYLANPAGLVKVLDLVARYHLSGVALESATDQANNQIREILRTFPNPTSASLPSDNGYAVAWRVQKPDGSVVSETTVDLRDPAYQWAAPREGGLFEVAASIFSRQQPTPIAQGRLVVSAATPTPTFTPSPTATPSPAPTSTPTPTPRPVQRAAAQAPAGPVPPSVPAVNLPFGYGLQIDPRGDTAANIGHIKALGFNWVKLQMPWKDVESAPGDFSWAMWDQLVDAYHANGIQILLSIPKAPNWARPADDDKSAEGPPQDPNLYAQFVAGVAGRYRGKVQALEIWNEQNLWYEAGGMGRISAASYVQLLQASYRAIKTTNPDMVVVSGALTPAGNVGEAAVDDIDYLNQMYASGAKGFFDALGAHPSGYNCPAKGDWRTVADSTAMNFRGTFENRHHSWCFRGTMEGYREVMLAHGDGAKAIVPTEFGWAVSGNPRPGYEYARDNTPEEQAQWITEAYQMGKQWGWAGPMFLWNLDYGLTAPGTELAAFGILDTPAYQALANMTK